MADTVFRRESPTEFFRELVEDAMHNQRVSARELTSFYVVNLLTGFIHADARGGDEPLGTRLVRAMEAAGSAQREGLRSVGDQSLFISGFFSDSLNRSLVDVDYYMQLGEHAYRSLARRGDDTLGDVFDELSDKFADFVDVLGEVSERTSLSSNADMLRLYEKWLRTRSRRSADLLASRGIVPNASIGSRFLQ
jgi:20S proteasome alpha/beta subunit